MSREITNLEETIDRLHVRLQQAIRALYTLHASGNDEMAQVALSRIEILNTRIAELNALLDSFEEPQQQRVMEVGCERDDGTLNIHPETETCEVCRTPDHHGLVQDVVVDDPNENVEMEYRGTLYVALGIILLAMLAMLFIPNIVAKFQGVKEVAVTAAPAPLTTVVAPTPAPIIVEDLVVNEITYTVQKGDTLWSIAKQMYGDPSQWTVVYGQNVDTIGANPDLIVPGQVLTLTKVSTGTVPVG